MNPSIPFIQMMFMDLVLWLVLVYAMPDDAKKAAINDITHFLESKLFDNRTAETYPLEEIAKAHESIEKGSNYGYVNLSI